MKVETRIDEEIESLIESLPAKTTLLGFYSYGELGPTGMQNCELMNQTMTVTLFWES